MEVDWNDVLAEINDKIARPMTIKDAIDNLEELRAEIDVTLEALREDLDQVERGEE